MKRASSVFLAILMLFSLFTPALAVEREVGIELANSRNAVRLPLDEALQNAANLQEMMEQARVQTINRDRTPLNQPVEWRFLWLAYTHIRVEGDSRDFRIAASERQWLRDIAEEFRQTVESAVPYISVHNSVVFMEDLLTIPREPHTMIGDSFAISQRLIQADLDRLGVRDTYDIVLTTVPEGDVFFVGGFMAASITSGFGYGGLSLGLPRQTRPNEMRWQTRVAIHEWLHMLEGAFRNDFLPGVQFPAVHGYLNEPQYAHYGIWGYCPDTGNWPYYRAILQGRLLYNGRYEVGMFPQMWRLTPRAINAGGRAEVGTYTIRTADGRYLFRDGTALRAGAFISGDERFIWSVRSSPAGGFTLSPQNDANLFFDVDNAWAFAGNTVKLWPWTGFVDAQTWELRATSDATPSYQIGTRLSPNLNLGVDSNGDARLFGAGGDANQRWQFSPLTAAPPPPPPPTGLPFTDVRQNDWFFDAVRFVYENRIMTGTTSTTFAPGENFSRAMAVTSLFRAHHGRQADAADSRTNPFTDVPAHAWFAPYITWAYRNNIVGGVGGNRFAPNDNVTREQLAAIFFRYADSMTDMDTTVRQGPQWNRFTDRGQISGWAVNPLIWANYHGLVTGRTDTTIVPGGTASRAEAAMIMTRLMHLDIPPRPDPPTDPEPEPPPQQGPFPQSAITLPNRRLTEAERAAWIAEYQAMGGAHAFELAAIQIVNAIRAEHGLNRLTICNTLMMATRFYAQTLANLNLPLGHREGPYGGSAGTAAAFGSGWNTANGAGGIHTPESLVNAWMNSPGHRANILNPSSRVIGLGSHAGGTWGAFHYMLTNW